MKLIKKILKESMKVLVFTSMISSAGGIGLSTIESKIITILPLLVLIPAMNNLIGSIGTITSSRFTSMLYTGKIKKKLWKSNGIKSLFGEISIISITLSLLIGFFAYFVAWLNGFPYNPKLLSLVVMTALTLNIVLTIVIFLISIIAGRIIYSKKMDPDNFLIPITTSVADLFTLLFFSVIVKIIF